MEQSHRFLLGVDRDSSPEQMKEGSLRSLLNFRTVKKGGKDLQPWHAGGNELAFDLGTFVPIGAAEYNGVSYILSVDMASGDCQIGTFPSPDPSGTGGFVHQYSPLMNWTGGIDPRVDPDAPRLPLVTSLFNFDCSRQAEVELSLSYDGSMDIYFADWRNPIRRVNSGFNAATGVYNGRKYWSGGLLSSVDLFFESCPHPVVSSVAISGGGKWPAGNTIFYLRYSTAELDKTSFLAQAGPVQVSINLPADGISTDGDPEETNTGNKVTLTFDGVDSNFEFAEIAFAYFGGDTVETGLIDRMYAIPPGSTTLTVDITGFEDIVDLTPDEIIRKKDKDDCPRSIVQFENRMWGANWKVPEVPEADFLAVAQQVQAVPGILDEVPDGPFRYNTSQAFSYKDYGRTLDKVGYFRGETYAFGIVFVLMGGKETRPFPVKGYDAWLDPAMAVTNPNGSLRMPSNMNTGYSMYDNANKRLRYLGVAFDTAGVVVPPNVAGKVCGFYFVRAERKPNLVYQGVVTSAWYPDDSNLFDHSEAIIGPSDGSSTNGSALLPEFIDLAIRVAWRWKRNDLGGIHYTVNGIVARAPNRFGLFSSDHYFTKEASNGLHWLMDLGRVSHDLHDLGGSVGREPAYLVEQKDYVPGPAAPSLGVNLGKCTVYNVAPNEFSTTGPATNSRKFSSRFAEGGQEAIGQGYPVWFYSWSMSMGERLEYGNRSIKQRRYLGICLDEPGMGTPALDGQIQDGFGYAHLANLYRTDPSTVDVANLYQPGSETYRKISGFIPMSDLQAVSGVPFGGGDCFLARTYHRHTCATSSNSDEAHNGMYLKYGNIAGFVQESKVNTSMRGVEKGSSSTYYPLHYPTDPMQMAVERCDYGESEQYNWGYHEVLGLQGSIGYDPNVPDGGVGFPNRIKHSQRKVPGSTYDAYRIWDLAAFEDFDPRGGQMVRIGVQSGRLFTVSESGLLVHSVNERGIVGDGEGGALVIGEGKVLSDHVFHIGDGFGSQHQWSIVKGEAGHYGYDHRKRTVWRFNGESLESVSLTGKFSSDVHAVADAFDGLDTDIMHALPDAPVCFGGVNGWRDPRNNELGWTFGRKDRPDLYRTLVLNEKWNAYSGERSHFSPLHLNIGLDMYSLEPGVGRLWLHDRGVPTSYYGLDPVSRMSFVANMYPTHGKVFDAVHLYTTPQAPAYHKSTTEYQVSTLSPFLTPDEWALPLYKEGAWRIPFLRADTITGVQDLGLDSMMRGKWMEVEFGWRSGEDVNVVGANVIFRISKT